MDILGRYGGDEFVVLLPETEIDSALQVADRLRTAICGTKLETPMGDIAVSVSVGVAAIGDEISTFHESTEKLTRPCSRQSQAARTRLKNNEYQYPIHLHNKPTFCLILVK